MQYIRVKWIHSYPDHPVWLISELDDRRWEIRKVEIFQDGSKGYATGAIEYGGTGLGLLPVPSIAEIAESPEFIPEEITQDEFEKIWHERMS